MLSNLRVNYLKYRENTLDCSVIDLEGASQIFDQACVMAEDLLETRENYIGKLSEAVDDVLDRGIGDTESFELYKTEVCDSVHDALMLLVRSQMIYRKLLKEQKLLTREIEDSFREAKCLADELLDLLSDLVNEYNV